MYRLSSHTGLDEIFCCWCREDINNSFVKLARHRRVSGENQNTQQWRNQKKLWGKIIIFNLIEGLLFILFNEIDCSRQSQNLCTTRMFNQTPLQIPPSQTQPAWFEPTTLPQLYSLMQTYVQNNYKLVVGNTSVGIYQKQTDVYINIANIPELTATTVDPQKVFKLGSNFFFLHFLLHIFFFL